MLSHRPANDDDPSNPRRKASSAKKAEEAKPMDAEWLEGRALSYISQWEASEAGVAALLERKISERCERTQESPDPVRRLIPALVARLVERNYVNDERFAEAARARQRKRGSSAARIRANLHSKGISESLVNELFDREEPDVEIRAAWAFAKRRRLGPYARDRREDREASERGRRRDKHLSAFGREGFEYELAERIVDADSIPELD
jgi:regulatory protein